MKKFSFRLERVERWRALQVHLQEERTVQAKTRLEAAQQALRNQVGQTAAAATQVRADSTAVTFAAYPAYMSKAATDRQELLLVVQKADVTLQQERRRMVETHRASRLLELLHEKQQTAWTEESEREAEQFAGEAFLSRVQSKKRARSSVG